MCRSFDLRISPSTRRGLDVEIYTYTPDVESVSSLTGQVWLELETTGVRVFARLTPSEARAAAQGLLDAASQAEDDLVAAQAQAYPQPDEVLP